MNHKVPQLDSCSRVPQVTRLLACCAMVCLALQSWRMQGADLPAPALPTPAVQPPPPGDLPPPPPPRPAKRHKTPDRLSADATELPDPVEPEEVEMEIGTKAERALLRARDAMKQAGSKLQFQFDSGKERLDRELGGLMSRRAAGPRSLVIPGAMVDEKRLAESEEDLNIMGRILNKALLRPAGDEPEQVMGIKLTTSQDRFRSLQNVHVEGQGALFLFRVSFPLVPPSPGSKEPPRPARKASAWEEARNELYGRGPEKNRDVLILNEGEPTPEFDEHRVAGLKTELLESLKQAANMRHLGPGESLTILVQGPDANKNRLATRVLTTSSETPENAQRPPSKASEKPVTSQKVVENVVAYVNVASDAAIARTSSLLIRVTKADVDAFAAGTLDSAAFTKRATVLTYSSANLDADPARKRLSF